MVSFPQQWPAVALKMQSYQNHILHRILSVTPCNLHTNTHSHTVCCLGCSRSAVAAGFGRTNHWTDSVFVCFHATSLQCVCVCVCMCGLLLKGSGGRRRGEKKHNLDSCSLKIFIVGSIFGFCTAVICTGVGSRSDTEWGHSAATQLRTSMSEHHYCCNCGGLLLVVTFPRTHCCPLKAISITVSGTTAVGI